MGRERAADEVFCRSCGWAIKRKAELCPHCGVRNDVRDVPGDARQRTGGERTRLQSDSATRPRQEAHATSRADDADETRATETSGKSAGGGERPDSRWRYGVVGSLALWIVLLLIGGITQGNVVLTAAVFLVWVALPVTVLLDARAIGTAGEGTPTPALWALATAVPLLNLLFGAIYLYRRHEALRDD